MATPEQIRTATKKLQDAVDEFMRDTGWDASGVLTSWVMIGHQARWEDDDLIDTYPVWFKDAQQSHHINLGLLHAAVLQITKHGYTWVDDNDGSE